MRIDVVTIFPAYLMPLREALLGRALERGLIDLAVHDLRTWTHDVHQAVDDAPYGGGPGMGGRSQIFVSNVCSVVQSAKSSQANNFSSFPTTSAGRTSRTSSVRVVS